MKQDTTVSDPDTNKSYSKKSVPVTVLEVTDKDQPLPVGTTLDVSEINTGNCEEKMENVEMKVSDKKSEYVETPSLSNNLHVEMTAPSQSDEHVETESSLEEIHVETSKTTNNDACVATETTSVTDSTTTSKEACEIGADNTAAD